MAEILVVTIEPLWPSVHGGRIRAARLAEILGRRFDVCVVGPLEAAPPAWLGFEEFPDEQPAGWRGGIASPLPRLGRALLGPRRRITLVEAVRSHRPRALLYAHSYLAAAAPSLEIPIAIDFQDVEVRRYASFARRGSPRSRVAFAWEFVKAAAWEPRVSRRAALSVAVTPSDAALLTSWGARVVLVPHGAGAAEAAPSPADGPVTFVANLGYRPNSHAARFLIQEVWPRLRAVEPGLRLRLVGRGAERALGRTARGEGIEVVADPESVDAFYRDASLLLAPVREGGGAQLKVTEALSRGRLVVATRFSAGSAPPGADEAVLTADSSSAFADLVLRLWRDVDERRARERALAERRPVPTWEEACAPLVRALERLVRG